MTTCKSCDAIIYKSQRVFCSNTCQADFAYKDYIQLWKVNKVSGLRGVNTFNISNHIKRYLFEKYDGKCTICNWAMVHPITKVVPLEIDHINGISEDNRELNLRLLCPNCHSLTTTYRNLNKGHGRIWRRQKYSSLV